MFDGLLKPKFYTKCKTCLKLIKTRLEMMRKKRNAVQKFLKKDIADLLRDSLDYNAYARAEGLLVEQNMSACYELIAQFVGSIYPLVKDLCKHSECPDGCKEAIPSLIYAAARFSDLPELRDLRTLFTEKFGNSLEPYRSKEFVERLRQDPPSKEMKIQFLHDLAQEFSIDWNSKALEQSLYSPPQLHEEEPKHEPQNDYVDVKWQKKNDHANLKIDGLQRGIGRDYIKYNTSKGNKGDSLSQKKMEYISSGTETTTDKSSLDDGSKASSSSIENENDQVKRPISYKLVPPPYYVKDKAEDKTVPERDSNNEKVVEKKKPIGRSVRQRRPLKSPPNENTVAENTRLHVDDGNDSISRDEDERVIDGLLMHYSKKQSPYNPPQQLEYDDNGRINRSNTISNSMRGTSLPPKETLKRHERATSLVPERMMTAKHHVHPSLPDYEDFTARLAALRARNISLAD